EGFGLKVKGKRAVDVGISTGGFTDCLLQHGAIKVLGFDVGYGQTDWQLRQNPALTLFEKVNFRKLTDEELGKMNMSAEIVVMDVSFISSTLMADNILKIFTKEKRSTNDFFCSSTAIKASEGLMHSMKLNSSLFEADLPKLCNGILVTLIKPQFELGKEKIGKGGIVKNEESLKESIEKVLVCYTVKGLYNIAIIQSPIEGAKGNREFLLLSVIIL
ncbi:MAG: hypothetical protein HQK84_07555, partial [Nitrospinae bacterium]|nr:hypothetical protein [Nitrospinota bacterium]